MAGRSGALCSLVAIGAVICFGAVSGDPVEHYLRFDGLAMVEFEVAVFAQAVGSTLSMASQENVTVLSFWDSSSRRRARRRLLATSVDVTYQVEVAPADVADAMTEMLALITEDTLITVLTTLDSPAYSGVTIINVQGPAESLASSSSSSSPSAALYCWPVGMPAATSAAGPTRRGRPSTVGDDAVFVPAASTAMRFGAAAVVRPAGCFPAGVGAVAALSPMVSTAVDDDGTVRATPWDTGSCSLGRTFHADFRALPLLEALGSSMSDAMADRSEMKMPCLSAHVKYSTPSTVPLFLPLGASRAMPSHAPARRPNCAGPK
eukprot:m.421426 g.421426  ORF g.421426 m.421426 type:complete len:320 (+) comp20196_c10_seq2:176-1135(+)